MQVMPQRLCIVCSVVSVMGGWSSWSSSHGDRYPWSRNTYSSEACGNPYPWLSLGRAGSEWESILKCLQTFWELLWKVSVYKYTQKSCEYFWDFMNNSWKDFDFFQLVILQKWLRAVHDTLALNAMPVCVPHVWMSQYLVI